MKTANLPANKQTNKLVKSTPSSTNSSGSESSSSSNHQRGQQHQKSNSSGGGGGGCSMDTSSLTFGPAWLRQLSTGNETTTFQLAKHRYGREEMLAIYQAIEKQLSSLSGPSNLLTDFEDMCKREAQKPVSFSQPSQEEQKSLSTCVNSQAVLKAHSYSSNQQSGEYRSSNSMRERVGGGGERDRDNRDGKNCSSNMRGSSMRGRGSSSSTYERGSGNGLSSSSSGNTSMSGSMRGRGRGRGGSGNESGSTHQNYGNKASSCGDVEIRETSKGGSSYSKNNAGGGSYSNRNSTNWDER